MRQQCLSHLRSPRVWRASAQSQPPPWHTGYPHLTPHSLPGVAEAEPVFQAEALDATHATQKGSPSLPALKAPPGGCCPPLPSSPLKAPPADCCPPLPSSLYSGLTCLPVLPGTCHVWSCFQLFVLVVPCARSILCPHTILCCHRPCHLPRTPSWLHLPVQTPPPWRPTHQLTNTSRAPS